MRRKKIISLLLFIIIMSCTCQVFASQNFSSIDDAYFTTINQVKAKEHMKYLAAEVQGPPSLKASTISPSDFEPSTAPLDTTSQNWGNKIIGIVQAIGSIVSVLALIIIGIKYMLGSTEEKAEYKSSMLPYLIGVFFLFFASNIVSIIYHVIT